MSEVQIGLNAAIIAISDRQPCVLRIPGDNDLFADALPFGPFDPAQHRTMEIGLRGWVEEQTGLRLGYCEQLYTFADRGRHRIDSDDTPHIVSVGYLALTRQDSTKNSALNIAGASWKSWYSFLPWEDWRTGRPALLDEVILPALKKWAGNEGAYGVNQHGLEPTARIRLAFGLDGTPWDEERVLERYELMYSAGLVPESVRDGRMQSVRVDEPVGAAMCHDHRRILATAISRLRAKLKYRPVVFELLAEAFTLTQLQHTVECISGREVHKQNFRRLVENGQLVEPTGETSQATGGRPAALYRFRKEVIEERPAPGLRLGR